MPAYSTTDNIVAPATVPGRSAIALLRISGPQAISILSALLPEGQQEFPQAVAKLARLQIADTRTTPQVNLEEQAVVTCFHAPASYTGDNLVEVSVHGNPLLLERLLQVVLQAGARLAAPGEFTFRAFVNGKLDLVQAEAVHELINAGSSSALRLAQNALGGLPTSRVIEWQRRLLDLLSHIETIHDYASGDLDASIDDADSYSPAHLSNLLAEVTAEMDSALDESRRSAVVRTGLSLAIVGPPNVGKSTLFNALLGYDRALVHHSPGTTRDYLSESVEFGGISFVLVDTAGQRSSTDEIESAGVSAAQQWEQSADLLVVVNAADGEQPVETPPGTSVDQRRIVVRTRCDLLPDWPAPEGGQIPVSGKSGRGIEELRQAILQRSGLDGENMLSGFNRRQAALIAQSRAYLQLAMEAIAAGMPVDAAAQDIHLARESLLGINQPGSRQDVIDNIFSSFCVGK